jgi:cysteinyl-tRNA synthetase
MLILNSHYRSPIDFSDDALTATQSGYDKILLTMVKLQEKIESAKDGEVDKQIESELQQIKDKFENAMNDDLNTAIAISVIFDLVRLINGLIKGVNATKGTLKKINEMFENLAGKCLGLKTGFYLNYEMMTNVLRRLIGFDIEQIKKAREEKDFKNADRMRNKYKDIGIALEYKADGTIDWSPEQK